MVEVFKTNVRDPDTANMLMDEIHKTFVDYKANFDLEDCDKILRVKFTTASMQSSTLIGLLKSFGYYGEVLPDDDQPVNLVLEDSDDINNQAETIIAKTP